MARHLVSYLAYGSNLHPQRLAARVGPPSARDVVELAGWSLRFHKRGRDGSGKCDIVPAEGHVVYGVVYRLSPQAKRRLDAIEGVGLGYRHAQLTVPGLGAVTTYRAMAAAIDAGLKPYSWYHRLVVAGARAHGLPDHYLDTLAAVTSIDDPDRERHWRESRLLGRGASDVLSSDADVSGR